MSRTLRQVLKETNIIPLSTAVIETNATDLIAVNSPARVYGIVSETQVAQSLTLLDDTVAKKFVGQLSAFQITNTRWVPGFITCETNVRLQYSAAALSDQRITILFTSA